MDMKNIFVIVAPDYTEDEVRDILKDEAYNHNFVFGTKFTYKDKDKWQRIMANCDEVWIYGQPHRTFAEAKWQHSHALKENYDIWRMG